MSIQYQKEIFNDGKSKLLINFSGINADDATDKHSIKLNIYAFDLVRLKHLFSADLEYKEIKELYNHLNIISLIREDNANDTVGFIEANSDVLELLKFFKIVDSKLVKLILDKADQKEKLNLIIEALTESEIQNLHASIRQRNHKRAIENLQELLGLEESNSLMDEIKIKPQLNEYIAGQPEKIFQNWIEKNLWALGIDYLKKHSARQIGINSESDLVMETTDGYIDLIELKRPKFELFSYDESHKSFYPSKELSKVIGQCLQYLKILEDYKLILEKQHKFRLLRPRIKIIVGRSHLFKEEQHDSLRMLNATLNNIQIITYDYLNNCGENIISYYNQQIINHKQNELPTIS